VIASRYDDETDAVAALIASRADELRVTSALHRIPGYLRSRPTVADAFRALEVIRDGKDPVEAEIAREALDMLAGVRRELRVYLGLQRVYEAIASAPRDVGPAEIRARTCRALVDLFTQTEYRIAGLDRLPPTSGNIVLCNHLHNHPTNGLPNGFSLILDTHFVSSMILYRTYGRPPVRVVRDSHWNEAGHARYYARLGYVMVPSSEGPTTAAQRAERYERFVAEASAALRTGHDLVICPEGCPGPTANSPARLRLGAFQLAARLHPEPMIVPVALANFDQRLSRAVLGAVVAKPFRMSDVVADPADRDQVARFVNDDLAPRYRAWVREAAALR
jgi:1-acyl-sn-glycerol-3-phosphate acyltransferase